MTQLPDYESDGVVGAGRDYRERARALAPTIAAHADRIEGERRLPEPLVAALHEAGLFRMLLPRALGGAELDPSAFVRVIEDISKTDASTAWCLCQTAGCSMVAAYLRPDVARAIFGDDPRGVLAWGPHRDSRAVSVPGGYRVTGSWSFSSGSRHATWLGGYCAITDADGTPRRRRDGTAGGRTMLFPAGAATFTDDWHVIGLRGTGSDTFAVTDLFVPEEHTVSRDDEAERRDPGLVYCFPTVSLFASGFAGVALGIARSVLDAFVALAGQKTARAQARPLYESAVVQSEVARGEARLRAARSFLLSSLEETWRAVGRSGVVTLDQRILIRLAATHAIREAREVADAAYHAAGATAIFASGPYERRFRDIHTVAQQVQGREDHWETVGRFIFGLTPDTTFL
ncbi:MAG TPA: acyl-CoA dehydrogenase family protein [Methylomirabilota bacterium]|jgi:alkylation response protein AidB-like acyl-CoA dehydrogenase